MNNKHKISYKLSEIASQLGLSLQGDDIEITNVNTLQAAKQNEISFLANSKYLHQLMTTEAGAVIISQEHAHKVRRALISKEPYKDFGRLLSLFEKQQGCFTGISTQAYIHPEAQVSKTATIYPFVFIGANAVISDEVVLFPGVYVGENSYIGIKSIIYPNVTIMADTHIGEQCIIHPGATIGGDGFGFAPSPYGIQKIPQMGNVTIHNNVEIGANTTIDKGTLGPTTVHDTTKIDNLVQVAHNVTIGKNSLIVSQTGISGSTTIGDNCTIAGQAGLAGHISIGDNVTIGPQSGVARNIPNNETVGGSPAVKRSTYLQTLVLLPRYPELFKRLVKIEQLLNVKTPKE